MPKRKRANLNYGNSIPQEITQTYINNWSNNQETTEDLVMVSLLFKAEGGSLLQILICEDESYNGIFHLVRFKFLTTNMDKPKIIVKDLDVLHDTRFQDYKSLIEQLPEIARKYQGEIIEDLSPDFNPLINYKDLPLLIVE